MDHMKNQTSALSDSFPSFDNRLKNWFGYGRLMLKYLLLIMLMLLTTICILPVSQDYCFLYHQVYDWASNENNVDLTWSSWSKV